MSLRECQCTKPHRSPNPRRPHACVCGLHISDEWDITDANVWAFFNRLAEGMFPNEIELPPWFESFREHATRREAHGRHAFGHEYLRRENPVEAQEEAADGAIYLLLDLLRSRREGREEDIDVVLTAAMHFAQAHRYLNLLRAKRQHAPG